MSSLKSWLPRPSYSLPSHLILFLSSSSSCFTILSVSTACLLDGVSFVISFLGYNENSRILIVAPFTQSFPSHHFLFIYSPFVLSSTLSFFLYVCLSIYFPLYLSIYHSISSLFGFVILRILLNSECHINNWNSKPALRFHCKQFFHPTSSGVSRA